MPNMFIKFENPAINGDLAILSWSHGFAQPVNPTRGEPVEPAHHANLTFTRYLDSSTKDLLRYCWSGKQIGKATLTCFRGEGGKDKYLEVVMEHVVIANYSVSGGPGDLPVENIALDYGITQYKYVTSGGEVAVAHDRINNRIS
jgi:type VI secretion system secreted protein Hcp